MLNCPRSALVFAILAIAAPNLASGQPLVEARQKLAAMAEQVAEQLSIERLPNSTSEEESLRSKFDDLRRYLENTSSSENRDAWLKYVDYDSLDKVTDEGAQAQLAQRLRELYWRLARNRPGLEREPVVELRQQALRYATILALGEDPQIALKRIAEALRDVAKTLRAYEGPLPAEEAELLTYRLRYIDASGLAPSFTAAMRDHFSLPNARVVIGNPVVQRVVTRPISQAGPSNECILGTRVLSDTWLDGQLTAEIIPCNHAAQIRLSIDAQFRSKGTGYERKIRVYNQGHGTVHAERTLHLTADGVTATPVTAHADLDSRITGVSHPLGIVRKIAYREAQKRKPQSSAIAEQKLANRVSEQFLEQSDKQLNERGPLQRDFDGSVLRRLDIEPPQRSWSSLREAIVLSLTMQNANQVSTDTPPPPLAPGHDIALRFHESAVHNMATAVLSERPLFDWEFEDFFNDLIPVRLRPAAVISDAAEEIVEGVINQANGEEKPARSRENAIEITFPPVRAIVFEARDGALRLGFTGARFQQGDMRIRPMEISAVYHPEQDEEGNLRLRREPRVDIVYRSGQDRGIRASVVRTNVRRRFEEVFPETIPLKAFPVPAADPDSPTMLKMLRPAKIEAVDGWFTVYFAADPLGG